MTASHSSRDSRDFTSTPIVAPRDATPAIDDGGAEWDHPHLSPSSDQVADSAALHAASRRRAIAWLDDEQGSPMAANAL
jgi:hypothetical protein